MKICPWHLFIIYEVISLHIYNRYKSRTPVGTAFAIATNICLTKDLNKNIVGALIAASIWKIISKNVL